MQDRLYLNFGERARQSDAAKLANLEAFRAALASNTQISAGTDSKTPEVPYIVVIDSQDGKVSSGPKPLLRFIPARVRTPLLAATAGIAALGAAACTSGSSTEIPQAPQTNQGGVLGEQGTPVPGAFSENSQQNQTEQQKKAPDFTLNDRNGVPVSLDDFAGRLLIIEYSQSGCPPCRFESTKLGELGKSYAGRGLSVLNISKEDDPNLSPEVPLLLDTDSKVAEDYEVLAVPMVIFIDREGNEVFRYSGYSRDNNDLGLLTDAFVAGKDLNSVLPTATPGPTETSTPVITKENISSDEAVFNLGNFDLGVKEWEEWPNAHPTQLEIGGKVIDVKNVVVKAILRSKADRVSNLIYSAEELLNGNVYFVDSGGQDIVYYPGSGSVSVRIDEPLRYGGAIDEPFMQNLEGNFMDTDLLCSSEKYTLDRFTAGYGIPVSIIATVPINVRDYGIAILEPGADKRKIVMKDEAASHFETITDDVPIHDPDYVFRLEGTNGEYVDASFKGLQSAQYSAGFPPDMIAMFHFIDRLRANPFHYPLLQGNLFLNDGRVLQIELAEGSLNFGQEGDLQGNVGGVNPENRCPLVNHTTLSNAYSVDLKDSVIVLNFGFVSAAWRVPDNAGK